jgi:hypothetical protein
MNFFLNLFRSTSPAYKQMTANKLKTNVIKRNRKPIVHSTEEQKYELSKLLTSLLRNNNYQFTTIANILNILRLQPKTLKLHNKNTVKHLFNRYNAKFNDNDKNVIN